MALASECIDYARTLLNDDDGTNWPDSRLLPKLRLAFNSIISNLTLNSIPVTIETDAQFVVPMNTTDITSLLPADFNEPIRLKSKLTSEYYPDFTDMTPRDFLPTANPDSRLRWWSYQQQKIYVLAANLDNDVLLYYRKNLTSPILLTDTIQVNGIEDYLGYAVASLALYSIGNTSLGGEYKGMAADLFNNDLRTKVKNEVQPLPAKRRAYHRKYMNRNSIGVF